MDRLESRLASGVRAPGAAVHRRIAGAVRSGRDAPTDDVREERRRLARALHDRLGADVTVAHRQLELYEVLRDTDPDRAHRRAVSAREALGTVLSQVRELASDLRLSTDFAGLAQSLRDFLAAAGTDAVASELVVTGDEAQFPLLVRYEIYLAVREAVRNALAHSKGRSISVVVDTRPDRLRAVVRDDGIGLGPRVALVGGTGLACMAERVSLLGGQLHIEGSGGRGGTAVEILVPAKP